MPTDRKFIECWVSKPSRSWAFVTAVITTGLSPQNTLADSQLTLVSDGIHRTDESRAATMDLFRKIASKHPREKTCLFLETTPRIREVWKRFESSAGTAEDFSRILEPLVHQTGADVPGMTDQRRKSVFLELQYFMAAELRALPNVDVFGIDFDYDVKSETADLSMARILGLFSGNPKKVPSNEGVDLAVRRRNLNMCHNVNRQFRAEGCAFAVVAVGSAHVMDFVKDDYYFPGYDGPTVKGLGDCLESKDKLEMISLRGSNTDCATNDCRTHMAEENGVKVVKVPSGYRGVARHLQPVSGSALENAFISGPQTVAR